MRCEGLFIESFLIVDLFFQCFLFLYYGRHDQKIAKFISQVEKLSFRIIFNVNEKKGILIERVVVTKTVYFFGHGNGNNTKSLAFKQFEIVKNNSVFNPHVAADIK